MKIPYYIYVYAMMVLVSCTGHPSLPGEYVQDDKQPRIFPDYTDVTVPPNIAPLNFTAVEADECLAQLTWPGGTQNYGGSHGVCIPEDEWHDICLASKADSIRVEVYTLSDGQWTRHAPFHIHVAEEEIDPYISYRVISPSYVGYEMLAINQRDLTGFDESTVYNNMLVSTEKNGQCINCHSYQNYRTHNMQFHMRQAHGGTMIVRDGVPRKVNLKTPHTISAGVYPSWHPTLPLIAYSTNTTGQSFHTKDLAKIEVQDSRSDLILYDTDRNEVTSISALEEELEVFPWWAPDGRRLYYCSAHFTFSDTLEHDTEAILRYKEIKYSIYSRSFDPDTRAFGPQDTVYDAAAEGQSATLPRVSPDGRYLLFARGEWGCFHIWHPDADLFLTDLQTGNTRRLENVNSPQAESYHSWSSNGRWMVICSRRDDGNYTRLYIAHFDRHGRAHKPFALPQRDPLFHLHYLRSYNVPEFMLEPVSLTPQEFAAAALKEPLQAKSDE